MSSPPAPTPVRPTSRMCATFFGVSDFLLFLFIHTIFSHFPYCFFPPLHSHPFGLSVNKHFILLAVFLFSFFLSRNHFDYHRALAALDIHVVLCGVFLHFFHIVVWIFLIVFFYCELRPLKFTTSRAVLLLCFIFCNLSLFLVSSKAKVNFIIICLRSRKSPQTLVEEFEFRHHRVSFPCLLAVCFLCALFQHNFTCRQTDEKFHPKAAPQALKETWTKTSDRKCGANCVVFHTFAFFIVTSESARLLSTSFDDRRRDHVQVGKGSRKKRIGKCGTKRARERREKGKTIFHALRR